MINAGPVNPGTRRDLQADAQLLYSSILSHLCPAGGPPIPGLFIGFARSPTPSVRKAAIRMQGRDSSTRTDSQLIPSSPQGRDRSSLRHSSRSNPAGSTPKARCAGIQAASKPKRAIVIMVPPSTSGSRGVARYTICANTRLAITPSSNPTADPDSSKTRGRPSAESIRWTGWAPRATRMPNSLIRFETEYIAVPKTPVTASTAASRPKTPRLAVATRAGNKTRPWRPASCGM